MKKRKLLALSLVLISLASPVLGFTLENPLTGINSIQDLVQNITNFIFSLAIFVAPAMIVIGAFMFMTSAGDPEKVKKSKQLIIWTVVGLLVILFSRGLLSLIRSVLGA